MEMKFTICLSTVGTPAGTIADIEPVPGNEGL